jgi:hypothetical protein
LDGLLGFTPLESPAIHDGDVKRKSSFIIEGGVKAPSFLTGFTKIYLFDKRYLWHPLRKK